MGAFVICCQPSQDFRLPPGEKPPLLIKIHGGPTSQASTAFSLGIQYWTSRGEPTPDSLETPCGICAVILLFEHCIFCITFTAAWCLA